MRRAVLLVMAAVLLGGPTVLAFFSGGYFDGPRLTAAIAAWLLVLIAAVASARPLPASAPARIALAGLAVMTAWSALSLTWAPLAAPALDNLQRLILYVGVLVAAAAVLRPARLAVAVEPALALGTVVVIGYGLAGRLLPGVVEQTASIKAGARLEQPLTYWNAEGALAAIGLVLCTHLAADHLRSVRTRVLAAAACAPLGLGVYLTYSRGAIVAAVVGLVVLLAVAPTRLQLRAAAGALTSATLAATAAALFPTVADRTGALGARERDGAIVLAILGLVMVAAAWLAAALAAAERRERIRVGPLPGARRVRGLAAVAVGAALVGVIAGGLGEHGTSTEALTREGNARLASLQSARYEYWRVGLRAFAERPLLGLGSGGFRAEWLRERRVGGGALDVHSLELEMATELGIPGLLALALLLGGVAVAARRALRRRPELVGGWVAAMTVWLLHATIDWDWQMPGVTLPVLVLAGALLAAAEDRPDPATH